VLRRTVCGGEVGWVRTRAEGALQGGGVESREPWVWAAAPAGGSRASHERQRTGWSLAARRRRSVRAAAAGAGTAPGESERVPWVAGEAATEAGSSGREEKAIGRSAWSRPTGPCSPGEREDEGGGRGRKGHQRRAHLTQIKNRPRIKQPRRVLISKSSGAI